MARRNTRSIILAVFFGLGGAAARAGDWTITSGGTYAISGQIGAGASLVAGDSIICDGSVNQNAVTIQIDSASVPALGDAGGGALQISNSVPVTIEFQGTNTVPLGNSASTTISITGGATLSITNAGGATGYFDYATNNTGNTLTINGTISGTDAVNQFVMGNNILKTMTATVSLNDVSIGGASAKIDADVATSIDTLTIATAGDDLTIDIAEGLTVTVGALFSIPAASIVTLTSVNGGVSERLTATSGIRLNGAAAELAIGGDDTNATIIAGDVTVAANGGILDINNSATISTVSLNDQAGDLTLEVATGKTLTTTVDVNDNTLTLSEAGTVSTVKLDTSAATLDVNQSCTITTCDLTADATIDVASGVTLTATTGVDTNTATLTLSNSGIVSRVDLDGAGGAVKLTAATGIVNTLNLSQSGTIDLDTNGCDLTISNGVAVGARTLTVSGSGGGSVAETLSAVVELDDPTSVLRITGSTEDTVAINRISFSAVNASLNVDTNCTPSVLSMSANAAIDVASAQTLTASVNISDKTLTLTGGGTITEVIGTTGTIVADGTTTIGTLTPSPGVSGSFTYKGTGASTVTMLTAFDTKDETFIKKGTGTLTVSSGLSFSAATGSRLEISEGTLANDGTATLLFGDDDEAIVVASGATFTTQGGMTGDSGTGVNLDAAAGSTVNFVKSGTLTLTSTADDDFKLLGTVNILDGCTVALAGAFRSQFGDVRIADTGALINTVPSATLWFAEGSTVTLQGTSSGTLTVDGQSTATRIVVDTTTGSGAFTIDRGASGHMTFQNVDLSNCTYTSTDGGIADAELDLTGVLNTANNTNWFSSLAADAGADKTIAVGESTILDGAASGGTGAYTYTWTPATGLSDATVAAPTAGPTETTVYTLTVSDGENAVSDTATVTVAVAAGTPDTPDGGTDGTTNAPDVTAPVLCGPGVFAVTLASLLPLAFLRVAGAKRSRRHPGRRLSKKVSG